MDWSGDKSMDGSTPAENGGKINSVCLCAFSYVIMIRDSPGSVVEIVAAGSHW